MWHIFHAGLCGGGIIMEALVTLRHLFEVSYMLCSLCVVINPLEWIERTQRECMWFTWHAGKWFPSYKSWCISTLLFITLHIIKNIHSSSYWEVCFFCTFLVDISPHISAVHDKDNIRYYTSCQVKNIYVGFFSQSAPQSRQDAVRHPLSTDPQFREVKTPDGWKQK